MALSDAPRLVAVLVDSSHLALVHRPLEMMRGAEESRAEDCTGWIHLDCHLNLLSKTTSLDGGVAGKD